MKASILFLFFLWMGTLPFYTRSVNTSSTTIITDKGKKDKSLVNKSARVYLSMDDYICSEDQWVYVYGFKGWISGNEEAFFDSVFVPKGQHHAEFELSIPCTLKARLFFSKNGPDRVSFVIEQDSCLSLYVDEETPQYNGDCIKASKGGCLNNFLHELGEEQKNYRRKCKELAEKEALDSIEIYSRKRLERLKKVMDEATDYPIVYDCFVTIKYGLQGAKPTNMSEMFKKAAQRFDWYYGLKSWYSPDSVRRPSLEAQRVANRFKELKRKKRECELLNKETGAYMELAFQNAEGQEISTKGLSQPYVLVDFWASWCKPCRQEIPYIQQALSQYGDSLAIYAVSLDNNRDNWQKAIQEDNTQSFIQVIGTLRNGSRTRLLRQLDIKSIPTNFLLDKERRIIAKDLRGDLLIQTVDSLMKQ